MKRNATSIVLLLAGMTLTASAAEPLAVKIYLPRNATVGGGTMQLGALALVQCEDSAIAAKASAVEMGRPPQPGETLVLNRAAIVSRLASCGIVASSVRFSGADAVSVVIRQATVTAEQLVRAADEFVAANAPNRDSVHWQCKSPPSEVVLGLPQDIQLRSRIVKEGSSISSLKVEVAVLSDGETVGTRELFYKPMFVCRRAVAKQNILAGAAMTEANVSIETAESDTRPTDESLPILGSSALRTIQAGEVILASQTTAKRPNPKDVLVHNNQPVAIRLSGSGFTLSALGTALQDGRVGEIVKVRNVDSQRIINARVTPDGNVEPIVEETCK
jgi:flagella basal body P-ring formation protein FlgA